MELYEACIRELNECLGRERLAASIQTRKNWQASKGAELIFREDTAMELGGKGMESASGIFYTDKAEAVEEDQILLLGPDIGELSGDAPFGRVVLIRINEEKIKDKDRMYQLLRAVEFGRYHVFPKDCMVQISALEQKESIRVSKAAVEKGVTLSAIGGLMLEAYHKIPQVEAVKIIFITDPDVDYDRLRKISKQSEQITKALDHLTGDMRVDCDFCGLKNICEEVKEAIDSEFPGAGKAASDL